MGLASCTKARKKSLDTYLSLLTCFKGESLAIIRLLYCYTMFASLSSLWFLHLLARITSMRKLDTLHATASPQPELSVGGVHLFYSCAVTFTCHGTCISRQICRSLSFPGPFRTQMPIGAIQHSTFAYCEVFLAFYTRMAAEAMQVAHEVYLALYISECQ